MKLDKTYIVVCKSVPFRKIVLEYLEKKGFANQSDIYDILVNLSGCFNIIVYPESKVGCNNFTGNSFTGRFPEISFEELIEKLESPDFKEVVLNKEWTAKVFKDKIVVGCQTFSPDVIKSLTEAYNSLS